MNTKDNSKDKEIKKLQRQLNKQNLEIKKLRDSLKQAKKEAKASRKTESKKKVLPKTLTQEQRDLLVELLKDIDITNL
jgi:uncharacterized tellurite resistance protein B-like protein